MNRISFKVLLFSLLTFGFQTINAQNCSVNAGIARTVCENAPLALEGSVKGSFSAIPVWTQVGGPSVILDNPIDLNTGVTGILGGNTYTFRLSLECADGQISFQDVVYTVEAITIAQAGPDIESCPDNSGANSVTGNTPLNVGETEAWSIVGNNNAGVTINSPTSETTTLTLA